MRKSRFTESQILAILSEGEAGLAVAEVCRKHGISSATYYQRISVACGLAQDAFTFGRIVPSKEVEDDHAIVPDSRSARLDRDELYPK